MKINIILDITQSPATHMSAMYTQTLILEHGIIIIIIPNNLILFLQKYFQGAEKLEDLPDKALKSKNDKSRLPLQNKKNTLASAVGMSRNKRLLDEVDDEDEDGERNTNSPRNSLQQDTKRARMEERKDGRNNGDSEEDRRSGRRSERKSNRRSGDRGHSGERGRKSDRKSDRKPESTRTSDRGKSDRGKSDGKGEDEPRTWFHEGLVVKFVNESSLEELFGQKAEIQNVEGRRCTVSVRRFDCHVNE
jgi:hypothetical protein